MEQTKILVVDDDREIVGAIAALLELEGYKVDMLTTNHRGIVDEGLKYVHNDICYPALLTIGQMISALKSGKYDLDHVALMMSQTGVPSGV